jgi:hypothetical protein
VQLVDPLDRALPDVGLLSVVDPESGVPALVDTSSKTARSSFEKRAATAALATTAALRKAGVDHVEVVVGDDDALVPLLRLLRRRGRRAA